jgi:ubiquinone/menaquinone biosynthesis C-methylase UbiE
VESPDTEVRDESAMSFDTLAPYYRTMEALLAGGVLQRCRTAFLQEAKNCQRALLLGEGPGRFLEELLRANRQVEVTCVERSPRMIEQAIRHLERNGLDASRVKFETCDALSWQPPCETFDLVVTCFFLDCFRPEQAQHLIVKVAGSTTSNARWLLADFRVPTSGWRRWRARIILPIMYAFFRLTTQLSASRLAPPDGFLRAAGFRLMQRRLANFDFIHSDLWQQSSS